MKKVEKQSIKSKIVEIYLRLSGSKKIFSSKEKVNKLIEKRRIENGKSYKFPPNLKLKSEIDKEIVEGIEVFFINSKKTINKKQILYLHGGAYINQPVKQHWTFLDEIAQDTDAAVTLPIYPKAPNYEYMEGFEKIFSIYEILLTKTKPENIIIMGDSSGGGLALALSELILEKRMPQPSNIILISPWLDITMKNPKIHSLEDKDPMLSTYGLVLMGKIWARDSDPNHYMTSPINGEIKGLGKISLFVGTHELFLPDAQKFKDKAIQQGVSINYFEYPKMNHLFPLYPIPEARRARKQIVNIINEK